jgi:hypothetical protein
MTDRARPAAACWAAGLAAVLAAAGCSDGPKTATVSGVVKVGGKEAEKGAVIFSPADGKGQPTGADIGAGGRYTARVQLGTMKVEVRVPKVVGKKALYGKDGPHMDVLEEVLPERYNNKTELTLDVTKDVTKDWDLPTK